MSTRPVDGTVAGPGHIVITVTDYLSADDISRVFGEGDGFFREVQEVPLGTSPRVAGAPASVDRSPTARHPATHPPSPAHNPPRAVAPASTRPTERTRTP